MESYIGTPTITKQENNWVERLSLFLFIEYQRVCFNHVDLISLSVWPGEASFDVGQSFPQQENKKEKRPGRTEEERKDWQKSHVAVGTETSSSGKTIQVTI